MVTCMHATGAIAFVCVGGCALRACVREQASKLVRE